MRNIIFDCERMKYMNTGLFHYCLNLGKHLAENCDKQREKLFFYTPSYEQNWISNHATCLTQNPLHKFLLPALKSYDIWHATYQNTNYIPVRNKKLKVVLSVHDLNFMYDDRKPQWKKQKYLRHLQRLVNRADSLVCISEFSKKDVLQYCDIGSKPLTVIHNGSNLLQEPGLTLQSYKPRKPFLFSIGVIHPKKNFHVLLPLLKNGLMELLIAGRREDRNYYAYLKDQSREMGVDDHVHILGQVSETEKSWYFNNCRAFAFPSISEGFGLPVVEAMSCGKPLFLSDKTALPEIGGDVSFYFRDFNPQHMEEVFHQGMQTYINKDLSERIKARAYRFNWNKAARKYLDVYRAL